MDTRSAEPLAFTEAFDLPIGDDGRSETFSIQPPENAGVVVIRVSTLSGEPFTDVCPILDDVFADRGIEAPEAWVPEIPAGASSGFFCADCPQRVHLGFGGGVFALPNNGDPSPLPAALTARVSLRECLSRLAASRAVNDVPASVRVEVGQRPQAPAGATGTLRLRIGVASTRALVPAEGEADPFLTTAVKRAGEILATAGITLSLAGVHRLAPPPQHTLSYGPGDYSALDALVAALQEVGGAPSESEVEVPVVVVGCLEWRDVWTGATLRPEGHVPRIPGGFGRGRGDGVFLRAEACGPLDADPHWDTPERMGQALAHEVGHYLGLYHVVETGGGEDHLSDTSPGAPNLMQPALGEGLGATHLTARQIVVIRNHPLVTYGAPASRD